MKRKPPPPDVFQIKRLILDRRIPHHVQLDGYVMKLDPKSYEVLWTLAFHAREVVRREDLLDAVWTVEAEITPSRLDQSISAIRKAFASVTQDELIATVAKEGYALLLSASQTILYPRFTYTPFRIRPGYTCPN